MQKYERTPLGYIELDSGTIPVYIMNDLFLTHFFENKENWEILRDIANILIDAYIEVVPHTTAKLITGAIAVETQYKYLVGAKNKTKAQDIKISEVVDLTFVEFQNSANTTPPIEVRATTYFGLAIGHSKGGAANQIWLLAEDVDTVLDGRLFARYVLKDELTGKPHPGSSGIMYISLSKLSQEKSLAGELAAYLLGKITKPENAELAGIVRSFDKGFDVFREDKEVVKSMSLEARAIQRGWFEGKAEGIAEGKAEGKAEGIAEGKAEGIAEGKAEGIAEGTAKGKAEGKIVAIEEFMELIAQGLTPQEASKKIRESI